jgi:hypothetical protein
VIVRAIARAVRDLLLGLFAFPASRSVAGDDPAALLEERYSRPRRCC